eukprot:14235646-Ditylum_brightwellii.AAC.1
MKAKTAPLLKWVLLYKFQQWCDNVSTPPKVPLDMMGELVQDALESQNELEWDSYAKGQISKHWEQVQKIHLKPFHPGLRKYTVQG